MNPQVASVIAVIQSELPSAIVAANSVATVISDSTATSVVSAAIETANNLTTNTTEFSDKKDSTELVSRVFVSVTVGTSVVQRPVEQVIRIEQPKGRQLVCR